MSLNPVRTGLNLAPSVGPMTMFQEMDFSIAAPILDLDYAKEDMDNNFGYAQALWFNNRLNNSMIELIINGSSQRLYLPAFSLGMLPIIQSGTLRVKATMLTPADNTAVFCNWLNTPQPTFIYTPS